MKKIAILGSTGSIGTQTLDVVRQNAGELTVTALAAGHNTALLEKQIREFSPRIAAVADEADARDLRERTKDLEVTVLSGMDGLLAVAREEQAEILVTAIVGMMGIRPTIAAIEAGKDIALANKETLVTAGHIIMPLAKENLYPLLLCQRHDDMAGRYQCLLVGQGDILPRLDSRDGRSEEPHV